MLTDAHCRNAKPREKLYRLNDHKGLYLEVKPPGVKAWRYRYTLHGNASMYALGDYPDVKLSEARQLCEGARKLVKQGISPAQQRQIDRIRQVSEAKNTFELVAKEWLQTKDWQTITKQRRLDMMNRVVFPKIGAMPVRDVSRARLEYSSGHGQARGAIRGGRGPADDVGRIRVRCGDLAGRNGPGLACPQGNPRKQDPAQDGTHR